MYNRFFILVALFSMTVSNFCFPGRDGKGETEQRRRVNFSDGQSGQSDRSTPSDPNVSNYSMSSQGTEEVPSPVDEPCESGFCAEQGGEKRQLPSRTASISRPCDVASIQREPDFVDPSLFWCPVDAIRRFVEGQNIERSSNFLFVKRYIKENPEEPEGFLGKVRHRALCLFVKMAISESEVFELGMIKDDVMLELFKPLAATQDLGDLDNDSLCGLMCEQESEPVRFPGCELLRDREERDYLKHYKIKPYFCIFCAWLSFAVNEEVFEKLSKKDNKRIGKVLMVLTEKMGGRRAVLAPVVGMPWARDNTKLIDFIRAANKAYPNKGQAQQFYDARLSEFKYRDSSCSLAVAHGFQAQEVPPRPERVGDEGLLFGQFDDL